MVVEMDKKERFRRFLEEYEQLCRKYGVIVDACGCCDSPWLRKVDSEEIEWHIDHLKSEAGLKEEGVGKHFISKNRRFHHG